MADIKHPQSPALVHEDSDHSNDHKKDVEKGPNAAHTVVESQDHVAIHDGIHDGLIIANDDDLATLRRVPDAVPWRSYCPLPGNNTGAGGKDGQSGALAANGLTTFNSFWVYVIPLFGAYIADTRWGRFKTVCIAICIAIVGHILLIMSAIPPVIVKPNGSLACFVIALIVMGLGTGGFKSNISPLIAEQYQRSKPFVEKRPNGEHVVVDPTLTAGRIYMYFYLLTNIGALIGQITMTYAEKFVGFWLAFLLPTVVFFLSPLVLYIGRNRYVRSPPAGSVLGKSMRIFKYCARGRLSWNPITTFRRLGSDDFFERAKPSNVLREKGQLPSWMTYDDLWVDEVRRGFSACAVFAWLPIYWLTYNQLNNNLVSQAAVMNTHGLPNDVLSNLGSCFLLVIFIPLLDMVVYPALRRRGYNLSALKRIAWGFFTGSAAMIWAAVVQHYIYKTSPCGNRASSCQNADGDNVSSPLNVWIQSGSYILIAMSEIFASITALEYAFTKAPKNMRSLVMSVNLFTSALSSALGEAFVSLSADPLLVWNYASMAVLSFIAGCLFWWQFRHLDAEEDELNKLTAGHVSEKDDAARD
ncbi:proton-dependent oligopeptide transport family protein [Auriculariales sp. MPI-PUGE-AT-0066]|nr:proton-dependent oligopeptide transport family protein [Auriculariales sp. MPI-PUGE-AT-0066]